MQTLRNHFHSHRTQTADSNSSLRLLRSPRDLRVSTILGNQSIRVSTHSKLMRRSKLLAHSAESVRSSSSIGSALRIQVLIPRRLKTGESSHNSCRLLLWMELTNSSSCYHKICQKLLDFLMQRISTSEEKLICLMLWILSHSGQHFNIQGVVRAAFQTLWLLKIEFIRIVRILATSAEATETSLLQRKE